MVRLTKGKNKAALVFILVLVSLTVLAMPVFGKTVLKFWYPWGGGDGDLRVALANEFNKTHPDIEVQALLVQGSGFYNGKLMAAIAGGQPPDVVLFWNGGATGSMAARGGLTDLSPYLEVTGIDASAYQEAAWKQMVYQGKVWGIPEISAIYCALYYNKDVFASAGLDPETPPVTIKEADLYAKKITRYDDNGQIEVAGLIPWMNQGGHTDFWPQVFGGRLFNSEQTKVTANEPEVVVAYEWMGSYGKEYGAKQFASYMGSMQGADSPQAPFYTGHLGMDINGSWFATSILKYAPDTNFGISSVPYPENGLTNPAYIGTNVWWVPKGAKHVKESIEFIGWMNEKTRLAKTADKVGNMASVVEAQQLQQLRNDPVFGIFFDLVENGNVISEPNSPVWAYYSDQLVKARDNIVFGRTTAQEALDEVTRKVQAELDKLLK